MSLVRFAEVCDCCGTRGPEYEAFTSGCEDCGGDICEACTAVVLEPFCCGAPDCSHKHAVVRCKPCQTAFEKEPIHAE